ncbi:flavin reductase family protein [Arthrobacter sp. JSM 101049]|uniref:flavin reductase family protein n=1 Tax=Arthrobacter sp. JSM 101049 TaxID=929097 RepID=UPI003568B77F
MTATATRPSIDSQLLRETFGHFPSGVAAIAAEVDGERHVVIASSFTVGVSLEPPLAMFSIQKSSSTWPDLASAQRIGVSILGAGHEASCRQLAGRDKASRFTGVDAETTELGAVRLGGAAAWYDCSIHAAHEAGDHDVIVFRIHDLQVDKQIAPLVFHGSRFTHLA